MEKDLIIKLLGSGALGGILANLVAKIRNRQQKGIDITQLTREIVGTVKDAYSDVIALQDDNIRRLEEMNRASEERYAKSEERYAKLEGKVERIMAENGEYAKVVSSASECEYLKTGDNSKCPVMKHNAERIQRRCAYLNRSNDGQK